MMQPYSASIRWRLLHESLILLEVLVEPRQSGTRTMRPSRFPEEQICLSVEGAAGGRLADVCRAMAGVTMTRPYHPRLRPQQAVHFRDIRMDTNHELAGRLS